MDNIVDIFKGKNFDEFTLKYINKFIEEFDSLFGKYIPKEELIKRIYENLDHNFEYADLEKGCKGTHNPEDKRINLSNTIKSEEELKTIIFHEMIHCITSRDGVSGFECRYVSEDLEEKIYTAHGLTEGFTQFVTQIRNVKYNPEASKKTYPILTEQVENLVDLLGEEEFLDVAFNSPNDLYKLMCEKKLISDRFEFQEFLDCFDILWEHEKEIYKDNNKTQEQVMFEAIFGKKKENNELHDAKSSIINTFLSSLKERPVNTIEELQNIYEKIECYSKQLRSEDNIMNYQVLWDKVDELITKGISREKLLAEIDGQFKEIINERFEIQDFLNLSPEDRLGKINKNNEFYDLVSESKFADYYKTKIVEDLFGIDLGHLTKEMRESIFGDIGDTSYASDRLFEDLVWGLADEIIEKKYDINKLSIEFINMGMESGLLYNLYESDGINTKYLSTYSDINANYQFSELKVVSDQKEKKHILDSNDNLPKDAVLFTDKNGCVLAYLGDDDYIYIDDEGEEYSNDGDGIYNNNRLEMLYKVLEKRLSRYQFFEKNGVKSVMETAADSVKKAHRDILEISYPGITPEDIEEIVSGTSIKDIEILLQSLSNDDKRRESFEGEIGYDG